mgnify:CR=1 FL=1
MVGGVFTAYKVIYYSTALGLNTAVYKAVINLLFLFL